MDTRKPLRRLEQLLADSLDVECPPADDLADVILGSAAGALQLRVAAHLRICPLCQELARACRPPEPRRAPRLWIARLATPPAFAEGRRSGERQSLTRQYVAAGLMVDLTVTSEHGEALRLTGQVLRGEQAAPGCQATLRARGRRTVTQVSDAAGFFSFSDLPPGSYTLTIEDAEIRMQIRQLELRGDSF